MSRLIKASVLALLALALAAPAQGVAAPDANSSGSAKKNSKKALKKVKKVNKTVKRLNKTVKEIIDDIASLFEAIEDLSGTPGPEGPEGPPGQGATKSDVAKLSIGESQELLVSGGITYTLDCNDDGFDTQAEIMASTPNADTFVTSDDNDADVRPAAITSSPTTIYLANENGGFSFLFSDREDIVNGDGLQQEIETLVGVNYLGAECVGQVITTDR